MRDLAWAGGHVDKLIERQVLLVVSDHIINVLSKTAKTVLH